MEQKPNADMEATNNFIRMRLRGYGIRENEASVYLALLQSKSPQTALEISERLRRHGKLRDIYDSIRSLVGRGVVYRLLYPQPSYAARPPADAVADIIGAAGMEHRERTEYLMAAAARVEKLLDAEARTAELAASEDLVVEDFKGAMEEFGIGRERSEAYVRLAKVGRAVSPPEVAGELGIDEKSSYLLFKKMAFLELVTRLPKKGRKDPLRYEARPLGKMVRWFVEREESMQKERASELAKCVAIMEGIAGSAGFADSEGRAKSAMFLNVLKGHYVYTTARNIAKGSRKVRVAGWVGDAYRLNQQGFFDSLAGECELLLFEDGQPGQAAYLEKELGRYKVETRTAMAPGRGIPHFIVTDNGLAGDGTGVAADEALLFMEKDRMLTDTTVMWTNSIQATVPYNVVFDSLFK